MSDLTRVFFNDRYGGGMMFSVPTQHLGEFIAILSSGLQVESSPGHYSNNKHFKMAEDPDPLTIQVVPEGLIEWPTPPEPKEPESPKMIEEAKKQLKEGEE